MAEDFSPRPKRTLRLTRPRSRNACSSVLPSRIPNAPQIRDVLDLIGRRRGREQDRVRAHGREHSGLGLCAVAVLQPLRLVENENRVLVDLRVLEALEGRQIHDAGLDPAARLVLLFGEGRRLDVTVTI